MAADLIIEGIQCNLILVTLSVGLLLLLLLMILMMMQMTVMEI